MTLHGFTGVFALLVALALVSCRDAGPLAPLERSPGAREIDVAARPAIDRFVQDFGLVPSESCGSFEAVPSGVQMVTIKDLGDRLTIQIVRRASWTNSVTGKTAKDHGALNVVIDFETGLISWNGNAGGMTIRGEGKVTHRSGKLVFEGSQIVFAAGHDRVLLMDSPPTLCDLLA